MSEPSEPVPEQPTASEQPEQPEQSTEPEQPTADAAGAGEAAAPSEPATESGDRWPARRRIVLTGISSRAWEHPADRGALTALRELRGFDELVKGLSALWNERAFRLAYLGSAIRVDHRQYPRVHRIYAEAAATLDIATLPELFVQYDRSLNGACVGMANPFIVINSGALELLDDEELRCLIGHELGHLLSGHAVYRTILEILTGLSRRVLPFLGTTALLLILRAMLEWWRKAELSADRAGLLASQDPAASLRLSMKLAGGGDLSEVDTAAFLEQAAEYERGGDLRDSIIKLLVVVGRTHPLPVARAAALRKWIDSGEYGRILAGEYPRREDDRNASVGEDVKAAAQSYRDSFAESEDPLISLLRRLSSDASVVGEWVGGGASRARDWVSNASTSAWRRATREASGNGPSGGGTTGTATDTEPPGGAA